MRVGARRGREGVTPSGYRPLFSAQEQRETTNPVPGVDQLGTAAECIDMLFAAGCGRREEHLAAPVLTPVPR